MFKKIYNEIKYLCKVATAGSKEARELEKVKRAFDKVWKESGTAKSGKEGTKYAIDNNQNLVYNDNRGERYVRTDEFRNLQAESQRMSGEELQEYHRGDRTLDEAVRGRFSRILKGQVGTVCGGIGNDNGLLKLLAPNGNQFNIYEGVNGSLFHDCFEISRKYLLNGELVTLHPVQTTKDDIGYDDCYNYLSEDGLSGFSITPDGDLISVFNASGKKGLLQSIKDIVKKERKHLIVTFLHTKI